MERKFTTLDLINLGNFLTVKAFRSARTMWKVFTKRGGYAFSSIAEPKLKFALVPSAVQSLLRLL